MDGFWFCKNIFRATVAVFAIGQQEEPKRLRGTLQNLSTFAASLKSRLVSQAVTDPLFKEELRYVARGIKHRSLNAPKAATIEGLFERVLYGLLRDIGIAFHPEKETIVKTHRQKRLDAQIAALALLSLNISNLQH